MTDIGRLVGLAAIAIALGILFFAVGTAQLPGTAPLDNPVDDVNEPRYDLRATVGVADTPTSAKIVENSFTYSTDKSTLASRAFGTSISTLAIFGTEGVSVTATLEGVDNNVFHEKRVDIGTIGELQSEKVVFKATRLPAGQYTLTWTMDWNRGQDSFQTELSIPKGGEQ